MARAMVSPSMNGTRTIVDDTLPMTCNIEGSQLVDGHGVYTIRVTRMTNDSSGSWLITRRFREFFDLSVVLKEYGFDLELPKKKILGNTDRTFMAERQQGLQKFLNALVEKLNVCNSNVVQQFLDPDHHTINYSELAIQHVSMFIRSMNSAYQIVEQFTDLGWRRNKTYFLATKNGGQKDERYLITWCQYGFDKTFGEKDSFSCLKILKSIKHSLIYPIDEVYANDIGTLTVCRYSNKGSLKDYIYQTKPINGMYWKRYAQRSSNQSLDLNQIKSFGRMILEALQTVYENGLVYGHLHSGNIFYDPEQAVPIKLMDMGNTVAGVSSKYRGYFYNLKQIRTLEHCDVYGFGRILYELSTGGECPTSSPSQLPNTIPIPVQSVIMKILSPTEDLPTIKDLLNEPLFQVPLPTSGESIQLRLSSKAKEAFEQINRTAQARLDGDLHKMKSAERRNKQSQIMTDGEKTKRRRERLAREFGQSTDPYLNVSETGKTIQRSISVDPLQLSTDRPLTKKPLSSHMSVDQPNSPQPPTVTSSPLAKPPPSSVPPPPPPPPPPPASTSTSTPTPAATGDRAELLNSITDFSLGRLKKAKTNDRSAPKFK